MIEVNKGGDYGLGAAVKIREKMIEENNVNENGVILKDFFENILQQYHV